MSEKIRGVVYITSEVRVGKNFEDESVVELKFSEQTTDKLRYVSTVVIDKATASRLINQLRRALDNDYNNSINERPERDASKDYSSGY